MKHQESILQQACVRWFRLQYPEYARLLFAVPNGVATTATQGRILKAEGMVAGVSDLILMVARKESHGLCIEMKTEGGLQRPSQKEWQKEVERQGYKYAVCRNYLDFKSCVDNYLN